MTDILIWIITILSEFVVYWLIEKKEPGELLLYSVLINSLTVPLANYFYRAHFLTLLGTEILVFIAEGILLMMLLKLDVKKAYLISLAANFVSFSIGWLLFF